MNISYDNRGYGAFFSAATAMVSPAHETVTRQPLYERVSPLEFRPGMTDWIRQVVVQMMRWHRRSTERRSLMALDDRLLQDIGVERSQAVAEGQKPFWQA